MPSVKVFILKVTKFWHHSVVEAQEKTSGAKIGEEIEEKEGEEETMEDKRK